MKNNSQIIIYRNENGEIKLDVRFDGGMVWLTQKMMSALFSVETHTVNYHLKEIFSSGELNENAVIRKIRITAVDGKNYATNFYNLDAIISVGYRINSPRATQFRIWATQKLKEYDKFHQQRLKEKTLLDGDFEMAITAIDSQKKSLKRLAKKIVQGPLVLF